MHARMHTHTHTHPTHTYTHTHTQTRIHTHTNTRTDRDELTEWHFGYNGIFRLQEFSHAIFIDGRDTEHVLKVFVQTLHVQGGVLDGEKPKPSASAATLKSSVLIKIFLCHVTATFT